MHAGAVRPGGPRVKSSDTVYCTHCFKNGSDRETAKSVKRNLPRHNKRCHSELDPVKDQAWMLVWTDGGGSAVPNNSFVSFLQASPPARLQSVVPNQIPAVGIPSQAQHPSFADASVPDPEVPAMVVCGFLFSVLSQREVYFQISNLTRVSSYIFVSARATF